MTVTDTRSALAANSAREHLLRLDRLRLIDKAQNEGFTLRQIADLLEISATQVHRLAQRVLQQPGDLERSPQEVIYQRSAGVITDDEMMDTLVHWTYTYGYVPTDGDQPVDAYAKGSWDEVRRAYRRGLLTDDEWDVLFDSTRTARQAQRTAARG
ncbi:MULTISPECIES: winged helix-turn-helix domain-containing protein [unclassified Rhodococcus (in: high G+C Gram-positive bacteria)]|uniref:winged helix-turn-helix domain-containing protein n=1 Tax=unclassified Rhodococcus (in: high G+C Gram-positive bacteria) TaxID=192944 RepID=UPI0020788126|nr:MULTISPECIES: winged helix-turn-helix domain-containing protein [unclassified Rhodococcus (in: high G+C Gram-positive bacteria)]